jgi:hypothetical protein
MIISLNGAASSGKDTVAKFIKEDKSFCSISFADIIKRFLYKEIGFTKDQLWGSSEKRLYPHPFLTKNDGSELSSRFCCNELGTSLGRDIFNRDIWIILTFKYIEKIIKENKIRNGIYTPWDGWVINPWYKFNFFGYNYKHFIINDIRYSNELNAIKAEGGKIIKIIRPGAELPKEYATHSSATEMNSFNEKDIDFTIINDGTLEELRQKTTNIMALIKNGSISRND